MGNLRHWSVLGKTDPAHTKSFQRAGGFRGTATRPIWNEMRLTEHFGPCGVGWGCDEPVFALVPAGDELLVYCTLRCWYAEEGKQASLYGVGGDKVLAKNKNGIVSDDEAYKKAFTDALGNAFKHLGVNADVHMGLFEDSKYVAEMRREFDGETEPAASQSGLTSIDGSTMPAKVTQVPDPAHATRRANAEKATPAKDRLKTAIEGAKTPKLIDQIIDINSNDLAEIKKLHEPFYDALMKLAATRKMELYGAASRTAVAD